MPLDKRYRFALTTDATIGRLWLTVREVVLPPGVGALHAALEQEVKDPSEVPLRLSLAAGEFEWDEAPQAFAISNVSIVRP